MHPSPATPIIQLHKLSLRRITVCQVLEGGVVGTKFKITLGKSDSFVFLFFLGGEMKVALIACLMGWLGCNSKKQWPLN